ncbi:iron complex transport system ATP-binding protein [Rhizobium sp. PP-F2F-G38]|uniref:ABC transporter ATP-binding protein n=1 Tax=Ferranicluibacter rubi TaxID=2715133 RepID=A0AA43ZF20_9HYPH|nr:ABC transporter ATP-binding protein [Ferranicluibacter rubi]PYE32480.1 iron complex transport system ATP-binding protein [Rhizobium sp. PP-WC-1G-195]PYE95908.1 iron complex transport system ATP-binding protein [Rhizobium sp. PP-F2F-G38]TCP88486.1 iron complex transport system ATP-binding protein [Rhizobium sp. PP-CC-2G-626]TCQ22848.1 iron complex transport system ATP-binding protein [Rhizobium sp. PP-CC-3G-465]NHT75840.1 ABC transporter ATP-binding protein [Ferranicluibacter rubi]
MSFSVENYSVTIGARRVVQDVSFDAKPGRILAVLGPNGAGKSTLLKGFCSMRRGDGSVRLDHADLLAMRPIDRARLVGYVAQDLAQLDVALDVFELLLLAQSGGRRSWRAPPEAFRRAEETLETLGLSRFARCRPSQLSGGERQMIGLALALVRRPRLLLLDEPTSALDLSNQLQILDAVAEHTRSHDVVTLAVLHDLNLATRYADEVLLLKNGRVHTSGTTEAVMDPATISDVYGVDCYPLPVPGTRFTALYPVSRTPRMQPTAK